MKIDIATQVVSVVYLDDPFMVGNSKWQGGVLVEDGCMYCMPCDAKKILKIVPGKAKE